MTQQTYAPDWSKAPPQANWWARDKDGSGFWYSNRPIANRRSFFINGGFVLADNDCPFINCSFELDNWQSTLTERPRQNCDITQNLSDYFSGKTPFITAYVDLLLARMAHEDRFSNEVACEKSQNVKSHDIIVFKSQDEFSIDAFVFAVVMAVYGDWTRIAFTCQVWEGEWQTHNHDVVEADTVIIRRITELEAVEFRKAMEAVYG